MTTFRMPMLVEMDQIMENLRSEDPELNKQGRTGLKRTFRKVETIPTLLKYISDERAPTESRQLFTQMVAKRFDRLNYWDLVTVDKKEQIRHRVLMALVNENNVILRNTIAQLAGTLMRHDGVSMLSSTFTSRIVKIVTDKCTSTDFQAQEIGTSIFAELAAKAPLQFIPRLEAIYSLLSMLVERINNDYPAQILINYLLGINNMLPSIAAGSTALSIHHSKFDEIAHALRFIAIKDPKQLSIVLGTIAAQVPIPPTNLKNLMAFCFELAHHSNIEKKDKEECIHYIGWLVETQRQEMFKQNITEDLVESLFKWIAATIEIDDDQNNVTRAERVFGRMTLFFSFDIIVRKLINLTEKVIDGNSVSYKSAVFIMFATLVDNCSNISQKDCYSLIVNYTRMGLSDSNLIIRNFAILLMGNLLYQPNTRNNIGIFLPKVFDSLNQICGSVRQGQLRYKYLHNTMNAIKVLWANAKDEILSYLESTMQFIFAALNLNNEKETRQSFLQIVRFIATTAGKNILPYLNDLIDVMRRCLNETDDPNILATRPHALEALADLMQIIDKEFIGIHTHDLMVSAVRILDEIDTDSPCMRKPLFVLFGSIARVLGEDMATFLPRIMPALHTAVNSTSDLLIVQAKVKMADDIFDDEPYIPNARDYEQVFPNKEYINEKKEALQAIKLLAAFTGNAFLSYIKPCYSAIYKQLTRLTRYSCFLSCVEQEALKALTHLALAQYKLKNFGGARKISSFILPDFTELIRTSHNLGVVYSAAKCCRLLIKELGNYSLYNRHMKQYIYDCIQEVFSTGVACQMHDNNENNGEIVDNETSRILYEIIGGLFNNFGHALQPQEFKKYFQRLMPFLLKKFEKWSENMCPDYRYIFFYVTTGCFPALQGMTADWFDTLLPVYIIGMQDENESMRLNAIYGTGFLVLYSKRRAYTSYAQILDVLEYIASNDDRPDVLENVCIAYAQMSISNSSLVPVDWILQVILKNLPFQNEENFSDYRIIFECFNILFREQSQVFINQIQHILALCSTIVNMNHLKDSECREALFDFRRVVLERYANVLGEIENANFFNQMQN